MNKTLIAGAVVLIAAIGAAIAITWKAGEEPPKEAQAPVEGAPIVSVTLPESLSTEAQIGKRAFDAVCAACHGENAAGRQGFGPPFVHRIYEPSHHGDMAFFVAAQRGVQAHHWTFGNMPPQQGLTRADIAGIVTYVRELQRANGID
ncbi:c-type cytochrome [Salipiger abyssi]|uniref:c-type cytochrome n=1 Tax=Salipiger abyssi TaxID=1250539 RepID=UPI001A8F55EE|nr:cytochrome c [Salipiger abyssi]MBN9890124.1 cytochrome c [Salipiger abyssi]